MSYQASRLVWAGFDRNASHSELLVMLSLADFARPDGSEARPSVPTVAERVRLSVRQVQTIISRLVNSGWLTVEYKSKGGRPSSYRLNVERLSERCSPECTVEDGQTPQQDFTVPDETTVKSSSLNHAVQTSPCNLATVQFSGSNGEVHTAGEPREQSKRKISPPNPKALGFNVTRSQAESIYNLYPRKVGKDAAIPAIVRAVKRLVDEGNSNPLGFLQDRVIEFSRSPAASEKQYTPHPSTWFNQGRYNDDPSEWQAGGKFGQDELDFPEHTEEEAHDMLRKAMEGDR